MCFMHIAAVINAKSRTWRMRNIVTFRWLSLLMDADFHIKQYMHITNKCKREESLGFY